MTEPKPCPFCGGEDLDVHVGVHIGRRHESVTITCNHCMGSIYGATEERAIEAWNNRTPDYQAGYIEGQKSITDGGIAERQEEGGAFSCSECGAEFLTFRKPRFCPDCGVRFE